jgi:hypothetical protein
MGNSRFENVKDQARETAASAGQTFQEAKDAAREGAANIGQQARETASAAAEKAREYASRAGDKAEETMHNVGEGMSHLAGTIRQSAPQSGVLGTVAERLDASGRYLREHDIGDIGKELTEVVRRYPIQSLLCVFGIGFLAGGALRR